MPGIGRRKIGRRQLIQDYGSLDEVLASAEEI
jgi:hypothetical protein